MAKPPLEDEYQDLIAIARMMEATVPDLEARLGVWSRHLEQALGRAASPLAAESALDAAALDLRHVWLERAVRSTSKSYRSPSQGERTATPTGRFHNFGYERDLQPLALEARCADFFAPPPPGWTGEHVLFSSGQAAMNAVLTLVGARQEQTLRLRYEGGYFETAELLELYAHRFDMAPRDGADTVIAEPVWCNGDGFGTTSLQALAKRAAAEHTASIVIDSTLAGLDDGLNALLCLLPSATEVFRLHSGLKLFQAGLELADVGIVSVYGNAQAGDELRRIRTLQGTGLRFADVAALELPLFLDAKATRSYQSAIFRHNAALASAAQSNPMLAPLYPAGHQAPFVVFHLPSAAMYDGLDEKIAAHAAQKSLVFIKGGSFGFRGHRFETVRPDGKAAFLRVAMGKRAGPSFEGILELFRTFAP